MPSEADTWSEAHHPAGPPLPDLTHLPRFKPEEIRAEELKTYALVRPPGEEIHQFELGFIPRQPVDLGRAREQHEAYCQHLEGLGVEVVRLPSLPHLPNSCLIRDAALLLDDPTDPLVVPARTDLPSRRGEAEALLQVLPEHFRIFKLRDEDRFEGGDVVSWGNQTLVGWSPRTRHGTHRELQRLIRMRKISSESLPVRRMNHLNAALAGLDEESVLISPLFLDTMRAEQFELIPVVGDELFCANMLPVGSVHLVDDVGPRTRRMLERLGHQILPVDLSEFRKIEAGASDLALLFSSVLPPKVQEICAAVK